MSNFQKLPIKKYPRSYTKSYERKLRFSQDSRDLEGAEQDLEHKSLMYRSNRALAGARPSEISYTKKKSAFARKKK